MTVEMPRLNGGVFCQSSCVTAVPADPLTVSTTGFDGIGPSVMKTLQSLGQDSPAPKGRIGGMGRPFQLGGRDLLALWHAKLPMQRARMLDGLLDELRAAAFFVLGTVADSAAP